MRAKQHGLAFYNALEFLMTARNRRRDLIANFQPGCLDRRGAADYLSISTRKLDDLLSSGAIKRIKLGRKTLVRVMDLDAFLAALAGEEVQ